MMKPVWLDDVIQDILDANPQASAAAIAQGIAARPEFLAAIQQGLDIPHAPNAIGGSQAQVIRVKITNLLEGSK